MATYDLRKECERCNTPIPDDYGNLLCDAHYTQVVKEQGDIKKDELERVKNAPDSAIAPERVENTPTIMNNTPTTPLEAPISPPDATSPRFGILDPNYQENPEMDDKNQILANLAQFIYSHDPAKKRKGKLLWYPQRNMYTFIKNYCMTKIMSHPQYPKYIWKPKIVDVGCGSGTGANILSLEADMVWGIDKNEWSIEFAREAFTREKNNYYYSTQLTFDPIDILTENRELMKFEVVVAIEVIEHIYDTELFLKQLIKHFTKRNKKGDCNIADPTEFFISSPNRAFAKLRKDKPANLYHVREWNAEELTAYLKTFFQNVVIMNQKGESVAEDTSADEVVLFKCSLPK